MPSYTGYQGYGSPERAKVDRARQMAELLQQGATDTSPKSFWEGAAQLGKAFIARGAMDKAERAETSYAKNQERLLRHFMDPKTDEDGYAMQPTINVGAEPETVVNWKDQPPAAATPAPASPMPEGDKVKALARALGGAYEGDGRTADIGAKKVDLPPMQPPMPPPSTPSAQTGIEKIAEATQRQGGNPALETQEYTQPMQTGVSAATPAVSQTQSSVSPGVAAITAALAPQPQAGVPPMTPAPQMAAPPATAQAPQSFRPPQPAAPNRQAALMTAMRMTGGNLQEAMSLVEAKYGAAPQGMSAYEAEQIRLKEREMGRPTPFNLGDGAFAEYDPNGEVGKRLNMLRNQTEAPVKMEQYTDATGQVWDRNPYTGESVKANVPRARVPGTGGDGGSAPPSGYRWNPDGSLSKIPGGPADKPEPGLYTPTEEKNYRGKAQALGTLKFLTDEYRTLVNLYGPGLYDGKMQGAEWKKTPEGQKLLASHNNLMMFLKGPELFNLGVLTGPDVERLQRTLPEPVGMGAFGQTKETLGIGLDSLDQLVGYQMTMIPEELRSQQAAAKTDQHNRDQNAGAILGGRGEFNLDAFRNMRQPSPEVRNYTDEQLDAMIAQGGGR